MLQVQRGTWGIRPCNKNKHGKKSNATFGKDSWSQAFLPIRHGGLGFRSDADLSLPCFLSSSFACQGLVNRLLPSLAASRGSNQRNWRLVRTAWFIPTTKGHRSAWTDLGSRDSLAALLDAPSPWNNCRLLTAQKNHTAAWSEAFPIASVGNLLSPDEIRIAIALRTGANIFESTECRCGKFVDRLGLHGLSCIKNAGRIPRHSVINSILIRSLTRIGFPSALSPLGLTRDRRRPDGLTLVQRQEPCGTQQLWTPLQKVTT